MMEMSDKIVERAAELFLQHGIKPVTMDVIAANLGMAKKTIYKFFDNKEALVRDFIVKEIETSRNNFQMLADTPSDPLAELFFTLVFAQKLFLRLKPAIVLALEKSYALSFLLLKQFKEEFLFERIRQTIQKGIGLNLFQDSLNVNFMPWFFLEATIIISNNTYSLQNFNQVDQEAIFGLLISGIATQPGLEKINWHKSQHNFASFTQTLEQPFWED